MPYPTCSAITSSGSQPANRADREHLVEVVALPGVDHVDQPVGVQVADPVPDGGEVGDRVAVPAVGLRTIIGALKPSTKTHQRTVVDDRGAAGLELGGHRGEVVVVDRLAGQVARRSAARSAASYAALNPASEIVDQVAPDAPGSARHRTAGRPPAAGPGRRTPRPRGSGAGPLVEVLGLRQGQRGGVDALLEDLLDQHAELGAPVADVVLRRCTWCPTAVSTRLKQSPMIVDRRCPTCICLATFGAE